MKENWIGNLYTHKLSYTYDAQNQLTKAVHGNGRTETYSYDSVGNIRSFNNGTTSHSYTYGDSNWKDLLTAVDGQAITYDGSGNPLSYYNGYRYTFNWTEGRKLASVTYNGHTTSYQYDYNGIRTKKTNHDGSYIVYDVVDGTAVGETHYTSSGTATMYMMYIHDENGAVNGIGLWYPGDTEWTYYYFVKNLQGDVLEVYNEDHSCVASYTYDSWGNALSKSGSLADINPFRYRGYYYDNESWFYYLQSRYYDPAIGRFINADILTSTGQGILGNNMFAYCGNNPVSRKDTTGTAWLLAATGGAIVGGLLSGASELLSQAINSYVTGSSINWADVATSTLGGAAYGGVMAATGSKAAASAASTATTTVVTGIRNGDSALKIVANTAIKTATAVATNVAPKIINKSLSGKYAKLNSLQKLIKDKTAGTYIGKYSSGSNYLADSISSSISRAGVALGTNLGKRARQYVGQFIGI